MDSPIEDATAPIERRTTSQEASRRLQRGCVLEGGALTARS